jgi:hypothetical protein
MIRATATMLAFAALLAAAPFARAQTSAHEGTFTLTSDDFTDGGLISPTYSCDKDGASPPLKWENSPSHVKTYALSVIDPDAPGGDYVHWLAFNIPDSTHELAAAANKKDGLGIKASQGQNGAGGTGWTPPCPPNGEEHHYIFRLYALDADMVMPPGTTLDRKTFEAAIEGHVLAQAELTGRYKRQH